MKRLSAPTGRRIRLDGMDALARMGLGELMLATGRPAGGDPRV